MNIKLRLILLSLTSALILTSCYRMPNEDDFSLVPTTNNPAVTNEKPGSFLPGMVGY